MFLDKSDSNGSSPLCDCQSGGDELGGPIVKAKKKTSITTTQRRLRNLLQPLPECECYDKITSFEVVVGHVAQITGMGAPRVSPNWKIFGA
jgi:hypothetical protein